MQLNELDKIHQDSIQCTMRVQDQRARWNDQFIKKKQFQPSDWALLFDSRFKTFNAKLTTHWLGPYEIEKVFENGSIMIKTIYGIWVSFVVNGHQLRLYRQPTSEEDFVYNIS